MINIKIPNNLIKEYYFEKKKTNFKRIFIFSISAALIQASFLGYSYITPFSSDSKVMWFYRTVYIVSLILNILLTSATYYYKKKTGFDSKAMSIMMAFVLIVLHIWTVGVAIADIFQGQQIVMYYLSMILLAIFFYISLGEFTLLLVIGQILLTSFLLSQKYNLVDNTDVLFTSFQFIIFSLVFRWHLEELFRKEFIHRKKLEFYSYYDTLSELYNRRKWEETYIEMYERALSSKHEIAIIMIDIDYFKNYNDTYGHVKGDDVIVEVSKILKKIPKIYEINIGRFGGDEFLLSLDNANNQKINEVINFVKTELITANIEHRTSLVSDKLTLSIGYYSAIPDINIKPLAYIEEADKNLYSNKKNRKLKN